MQKSSSLIYILIFTWAVIIFCFSSQPGPQSAALSEKTLKSIAKFVMPDFEKLSLQTQHEILNDLGQRRIRKIAHFILYLIFAMLIMSALKQYEASFLEKCLIVILICSTYATLDEWHQHYIKGRASQVFDIFVDASGAFIGILLFNILTKITKFINSHNFKILAR